MAKAAISGHGVQPNRRRPSRLRFYRSRLRDLRWRRPKADIDGGKSPRSVEGRDRRQPKAAIGGYGGRRPRRSTRPRERFDHIVVAPTAAVAAKGFDRRRRGRRLDADAKMGSSGERSREESWCFLASRASQNRAVGGGGATATQDRDRRRRRPLGGWARLRSGQAAAMATVVNL